MKQLIYILFLLFTVNSIAYSQYDIPEDSTWNLDNLDFENAFEEAEEVKIKISTGWFPRAFDFDLNFGLLFETGYGWNYARDIRPTSLVTTKNSYSSMDPFTLNEAKIKDHDNNNDGSSHRSINSTAFGLQFKVRTPIYLHFLFDAKTEWNHHFLYAVDHSKSFLSHQSQLENFKEVTVARIDDIELSASGGLMLPIYGAFLEDAEDAETHYYLYVGGALKWSWLPESKNYAQIANADHYLRYRNGLDTLTMINQDIFEDFNRTRIYLDIAAGSMYHFNGVGFSFYIRYNYLTGSLIESADWKRHSIRLGLSMLLKGVLF